MKPTYFVGDQVADVQGDVRWRYTSDALAVDDTANVAALASLKVDAEERSQFGVHEVHVSAAVDQRIIRHLPTLVGDGDADDGPLKPVRQPRVRELHADQRTRPPRRG